LSTEVEEQVDEELVGDVSKRWEIRDIVEDCYQVEKAVAQGQDEVAGLSEAAARIVKAKDMR